MNAPGLTQMTLKRPPESFRICSAPSYLAVKPSRLILDRRWSLRGSSESCKRAKEMNVHSVAGWEINLNASLYRRLCIIIVNFMRDGGCGGIQEDVDAFEGFDRDGVASELNSFCPEIDEVFRASGRWVACKENNSANSGGSVWGQEQALHEVLSYSEFSSGEGDTQGWDSPIFPVPPTTATVTGGIFLCKLWL